MSRIMFVVGILATLTSALLSIGPGTEESGSSLIVLCVFGLSLIGASRFQIVKM
jgi:hypothetical protein